MGDDLQSARGIAKISLSIVSYILFFRIYRAVSCFHVGHTRILHDSIRVRASRKDSIDLTHVVSNVVAPFDPSICLLFVIALIGILDAEVDRLISEAGEPKEEI